MANHVTHELLRFDIQINGHEGQAQINKLAEDNKKLARSIDETKGKLKDLATAQRQNKAETDKVNAKITELSKNYNANSAEIDRQRQKLTELSATRNKNQAEIDETRKKLSQLKAEYNENLAKIDATARSMSHLDLTTAQLKRRIDELRFAMKHIDPNTKEYAALGAEVEKLDYRYRQLNSGMGRTAFWFKDMSDKINQYSAMITTAIVAFTAVAAAIYKAIEANNKLADAQTTVEKTTGLSVKQVKELTEAFEEFDTRTSKLDLLKIAEVGGRLGVAKEEIQEFTREVDKIYVALGDAFSGGVEQVTELLGKIKGLYKETRDLNYAEALNQIGSAMNELGAAGAASEENIGEFAKRVGSLPDSLRPSIADALALGAAFEESGIDAERSATAYSSVLKISARNAKGLTEVMKQSQEEIEKLINTDPTEFFLKFAESVKGMNAVDLAKFLDDMKLNDQYVSSILTAASGNMTRFRETIALSNSELQKATSLQIEFNKVNNNTAAKYDKIKKSFEQMYTSEKVAKTLDWLVTTFGRLIGVLDQNDKGVQTWRNRLFLLVQTITVVVASIASYRVAIALSTLITNASTSAVGLWSAALKLAGINLAMQRNITLLAAAAKALFTLNLTRATAAMKLFNASVKMNPLGILFTAVTAVIGVFLIFQNQMKKTREEQRKLAEEQNRYQTEVAGTIQKGKEAVETYKSSIETLIHTIKSENATQEMRKKAYEALIKIHPQFIGTLDEQFRKTDKLNEVYKDLARNIELVAIAEARKSAKQSIYNEREKLRMENIRNMTALEAEEAENARKIEANKQKIAKANRGIQAKESYTWDNMSIYDGVDHTERNKKNATNAAINKLSGVIYQFNSDDKKTIDSLIKRIAQAKKDRNEKLAKDLQAQLDALLGITSNSTTNNDGLGNDDAGKGGKGDKSDKKTATKPEKTQYQKDLEEMLKLAEKYGDKNLDLQSEIEKRKIEMMEDGYEKEKDLLEFESNEKIKSYEKQKISAEEFAKLQDLIAKTKPGKVKDQLEEELDIWKNHNQHLTDLQLQETEIRILKESVLREKAIAKSYEDEDVAMKKRLKLKEREVNQTLALSLKEQKDWLKNRGYSDENLAKIKTWEDARKAIEKTAKKEQLEEQLDYFKKQLNVLSSVMTINPLEIGEEQIKRFSDLSDIIAQISADLAGINNEADGDKKLGGRLDGVGGGSKDIFGLSPDQWEAMFTSTTNLEENIQKVSAAIGVMQNMMSTYFAYVEANEKRQLQTYERNTEAKKKSLKRQLDEGYINQETYKKLTLKADQDLDKKKWEMEVKAAKRQKAMAIAQTVTNTAAAIMGIWKDVPKFDFGSMAFILSALVGGLGAVQVATIAAQPLPEAPGAEEGLYPVIREQDGKVFSAKRKRSKSGVYAEPTLLVGEAGASMPELVVSGRDLKRIDPDITRMFMQDIARVRGAEKGLYPVNNTIIPSSNNDEVMLKMMILLDENTKVMREIKDYGIKAFIDKSARNGKELKETIKSYDDLNNKNKH